MRPVAAIAMATMSLPDEFRCLAACYQELVERAIAAWREAAEQAATFNPEVGTFH
jgi:hypothetical protein